MKRGNAYGPRRQNRETVIYGISVERATGRHYCFNRDYFVLPVTLPAVAVKAIAETARTVQNGTRAGHGRFRPGKLGAVTGWDTFFIFKDGSAPKWSRLTYKYDQTPYETQPQAK